MAIFSLSSRRLKSYNQPFVQLLALDATALSKRDLEINDIFALKASVHSELINSAREQTLKLHAALQTDEAAVDNKRVDQLGISLVTSVGEWKSLQLTMVPLAGKQRVLWLLEDPADRRAPIAHSLPALHLHQHLQHAVPAHPHPASAPARPIYQIDSPPVCCA